MAKLPTPAGVQITMDDGRVFDFQTSLGDQIVLHLIDTLIKGKNEALVRYYNIIIIAKEDVYDDNTYG